MKLVASKIKHDGSLDHRKTGPLKIVDIKKAVTIKLCVKSSYQPAFPPNTES